MDLVDHRGLAHCDRLDLSDPASQLAVDESARSAQIGQADGIDIDGMDGSQCVDRAEGAIAAVLGRDRLPLRRGIDRESGAVIHEHEGHVEDLGVIDDVEDRRHRHAAVVECGHDPPFTADVVSTPALVTQRRTAQNPAGAAVDEDGEREVGPTDRHHFDVEIADSESLLDPSADAVRVEPCR